MPTVGLLDILLVRCGRSGNRLVDHLVVRSQGILESVPTSAKIVNSMRLHASLAMTFCDWPTCYGEI